MPVAPLVSFPFSRPLRVYDLRFSISIGHARARVPLARGKKHPSQRRRRQRRLLKCETAKRPAAKRRDTLSCAAHLSSYLHLASSSLRRPSIRPYVYVYTYTCVRSTYVPPIPPLRFCSPLPPLPLRTLDRSGGKTSTRSRAHPSSALATGWLKTLGQRWENVIGTSVSLEKLRTKFQGTFN